MQIITNDVLEDIKKRANCSIHTTFSDPPYFLGSEWQIQETREKAQKALEKNKKLQQKK